MSQRIDLFDTLPSDYYSYLLSKTKAEKELLEFLGFQIEKSTDLLTRVEYTNKQYNCSRMDLAVLSKDLIPKQIIEAKYYYSFDGYRIHTRQLARKSEVEKDVKKLNEIPKSIDKYFLLFLVHFDAETVPSLFPYSYTHNRVMTKFEKEGLDHSDLRQQSLEITKKYLVQKGLGIEIKEFEVGIYDEIPVILQTYFAKI